MHKCNVPKLKNTTWLFFALMALSCNKIKYTENHNATEAGIEKARFLELPPKNQIVVNTVKKYGPEISSTYEKAVCTEFVIQVLEKIQDLDKIDRNRIRIITDKSIQELLKSGSNIPKGVYFSLTEKGIGIAIDNKDEVCEGDFVQFWNGNWGHCGIVKSISINDNEMELYSSSSTNGYGIQKFNVPEHAYFVRLK